MDDVVYVIGCGDGRVLIQMAAMFVLPSVTGGEALSSNDDHAVEDICHGGNNGSSSEQLIIHDEGNNHQQLPEQQHQSSLSTNKNDNKPQHHHHHRRNFIGIEISFERAAEARDNIRKAQQSNIQIICANALDTSLVDYTQATVVFLYLVPRGLRLIKSVVWPKEEEEEESRADCAIAAAQQSLLTQPQEAAGKSAPASVDKQTEPKIETIQSTLYKKPRRIITYMALFERSIVRWNIKREPRGLYICTTFCECMKIWIILIGNTRKKWCKSQVLQHG